MANVFKNLKPVQLPWPGWLKVSADKNTGNTQKCIQNLQWSAVKYFLTEINCKLIYFEAVIFLWGNLKVQLNKLQILWWLTKNIYVKYFFFSLYEKHFVSTIYHCNFTNVVWCWNVVYILCTVLCLIVFPCYLDEIVYLCFYPLQLLYLDFVFFIKCCYSSLSAGE